jgi:hypothetical protein
MEIVDSRHVTPDRFSIEEVRVVYDWSQDEPSYVSSSLIVSLKPEGYLRSRFADGGVSYETKKHGARQLKIHASEFEQMMEAFNEEVKLCHQVLLENGLMPKLAEARPKKPANEQPSAQPVRSISG